MKDGLDDLLGQYWDLAFAEGLDGASRGTEANEVLAKIRALFRANAAQEPVAWMHESPSRCDVIHEKVRALLQSNHERHNLCGQVERPPVNTVEHYTIPLFSAPPSSAVLVEALENAIAHIRQISGKDLSCDPPEDVSEYEESLAQYRSQK